MYDHVQHCIIFTKVLKHLGMQGFLGTRWNTQRTGTILPPHGQIALATGRSIWMVHWSLLFMTALLISQFRQEGHYIFVRISFKGAVKLACT